MTVWQLWQQYEYHLRIRRRSVNTLNFYRVGAQGFTTFLVAEGVMDDIATLTVTHLRSYMTWLEARGLGIGGIHARGRTLKALFNFALREELIERNPVTRLELPTLPHDRLPAIAPDQVQASLECSKHSLFPLRDRAMVLTLFDTGIRVSELVGLRLGDLRLERGLIRVLGKGNKERFVPVGSRAMLAMTAYIRRERKPFLPVLDQLLLGRSGKPFTRFGVSQRLADIATELSLPVSQLAPHAFRRGFAVQFLRNGSSVFELQQILGHTSLEMTRRYVNFLDEDLKAAHLRSSPGDRL